MQRVFVLDSSKNPLMPCHPARARELLNKGKAKVYRFYPFTIILTKRNQGVKQTVELKIDPGSKVTGIALVGHFKRGLVALFGSNLSHQAEQIKKKLLKRRAIRRSRRNRKTGYRKPRFNNRTRKKGWLAPSLNSRVENIFHWTKKLKGLTEI